MHRVSLLPITEPGDNIDALRNRAVFEAAGSHQAVLSWLGPQELRVTYFEGANVKSKMPAAVISETLYRVKFESLTMPLGSSGCDVNGTRVSAAPRPLR